MPLSPGTPPRLLRDLFVAAYPGYVRERLVASGLPAPEGLDSALERGSEWLGEQLDLLLTAPPAEQRRSPLEVFQEAMRFPSAVLERAGVPSVPRDAAVATALPGDRYDLAPGSSQPLGDEAWRAHLAWGAHKAAAMGASGPAAVPQRPIAALFGADLMTRSRIEGAAGAAGYDLRIVSDVGDAAASTAVVAFVDLAADAADSAIRSFASAGIRTIAFGPHVDDFALARARTLGAHDALARSRFFKRLPNLLPPVV